MHKEENSKRERKDLRNARYLRVVFRIGAAILLVLMLAALVL